MKKIILIILIFFIFCPTYCLTYSNTQKDNNELAKQEIIDSQKNTLNIGEFLKEAKNYTENTFEDIDYNEFLNSAITGNIDNKKLSKGILDILGKETASTITTISSIMVVIIVHSILKSISENLENEGIAKVSYYVQYILIVTLIMKNFSDIIAMLKNSVQDLVCFSNTLIPILITLILTTGNIATANIIQPILLFLITFIGNLIQNIIIPVLLASTALGIVSKISDYVQLDRLSKFLKSSLVWSLGIILTLFVSLVSIEGSLSSSVDGITAKTAKAAVSSVIPVVGKILGDAVDTVIGCTSILKNAVGIVGVIVIIGICITPIVKLLLMMISYYIGASLCEPIADSKIVKLLSQMGDTFKVMLAILSSLSVMLIIGTTLVIKISNSGLMYR